jgi:hypothetical protein
MEEATNKIDTLKQIPSFLIFNDSKLIPPGGHKRALNYSAINNPPFNQTNNTITFSLGGKGFLDPYSMYIKVKVTNLNSKIPLQVDNSAHSLFSKISFKGNGTEFETIEDYDLMMSNISDCSKENDERRACEIEGYGCSYDKNALYKTDNPLCVGNCEPIIQPRGINTKDLYTMSHDRFVRNVNTVNKAIVAFNEVRHGVPTAEPLESDSRTFIIPVWSFLFGWGISAQNYKYIPLQVFAPLEVSFKLNEHAFFVPLPNSGMYSDQVNIQVSGSDLRKIKIESGDLTEFKHNTLSVTGTDSNKVVDVSSLLLPNLIRLNPMEGEDTGVYEINNVINAGRINNPVRKGWQIVHAQLLTEQMFFEPYIHDDVLNQPVFRIVTHQYKKIREVSFTKANMPANIQITDLKGSVKYMHFCFLNNSYLRSCFQRKLFKYSMNLKGYTLKVANEIFPPENNDGNAGTTNGDENNLNFFMQLKRCAYKTNKEKNMAINPYNFALNYSPLDIISSDVFCPVKMFGYNEYIGRCIYALDFERFPQSEGYWSGISMRGSANCELSLRSALYDNAYMKHSEGANTTFTIYVFVWIDYVVEFNRMTGKWEFKD